MWRTDRIGARRAVLRWAGLQEPALTTLSTIDVLSPTRMERVVAGALRRQLGPNGIAREIMAMVGPAPGEPFPAPVVPEFEAPRERQVRILAELVRSAIARRETVGIPVDEAELLERFRPAVCVALRALGIDGDGADVEARELWSAAWAIASGK